MLDNDHDRWSSDSMSLLINNTWDYVCARIKYIKCIFGRHCFQPVPILHLGSLPLDAGLHLQLPQREVIVHEQSVPAHCGADVRRLRCHVPGQQVVQPAAGLRAEQLVGTHRVHVVVQRRQRALRGDAQRLDHVGSASAVLKVPSGPSSCLSVCLCVSSTPGSTEATPFPPGRGSACRSELPGFPSAWQPCLHLTA